MRASPVVRSAAAVLVALAVAIWPSGPSQPEDVGAEPVHRWSRVVEALPGAALRRAAWWGGVFTTRSGEEVRVYVSEAYPQEDARAQEWADALGAFVHGAELEEVTVYLGPVDVVEQMCGADALGCYSLQEEAIVSVADDAAGTTALQVVEHEYGHHVANHRANPPWSAAERGAKRWATYADVCRRMEEGSAGTSYALDPSEAFAEAYRVLLDRDRGLARSWPLVDATFMPDARALEQVRRDVTTPWRPTAFRLRLRLPVVGAVRRVRVATPLDGTLTAQAVPRPGLRVALRIVEPAPPGGTARGVGRATATICGRRRATVEVRALAGSGTATVAITRP